MKNRANGASAPVQETEQPASPAPTPQPAQSAPAAKATTSAPAADHGSNVEIIEMDRMRKLIANHMVNSKATSPHGDQFYRS